MADRPILFSAPMVNALLREAREPGSGKTQTRRLISPQPETFMVNGAECEVVALHVDGEAVPRIATGRVLTGQKLRYAAGDRLYVREEWKSTPAYDDQAPSDMGGDNPVYYTADGATFNWAEADGSRIGRRRAGMHMPRWASRLTLIVEDVRVERLNALTEADALAEGIVADPVKGFWVPGVDHPNKDFPWLSRTTAREMYAALWDTLHGSGEWLGNPWVVAVTFRVIANNIDQVPA